MVRHAYKFTTCGHQTLFHCCTHARRGNTNFDLKGSGFIPIAGIVELVNRTLVYGVPLLTRRKRREDEWEKTEEKNGKNQEKHWKG